MLILWLHVLWKRLKGEMMVQSSNISQIFISSSLCFGFAMVWVYFMFIWHVFCLCVCVWKELLLKDEECERLSKVRDQLGQELEELTASLFQVGPLLLSLSISSASCFPSSWCSGQTDTGQKKLRLTRDLLLPIFLSAEMWNEGVIGSKMLGSCF